MSTILDPKSITLLRVMSRGGWASLRDLADAVSVDYSDAVGRVQALKESGIITGFRALPFLPALEGGEWSRYVVRVHKPDPQALDGLMRELPGLEESLHNAVFSTKRFPRTSFFCFSKTAEELKLAARQAGIDEEPLHVLSYNFPFSASLSGEERLLLRTVNSTGEIVPTSLGRKLGKDSSWVETKLARLVLHSQNPQGVAILRATIHWYRIDNFVHAHLLLPLEAKSHVDSLCRGLRWRVLKWPPESSETFALEADLSGWGHLAEWKSYLELAGFAPQGFALFAEERIHGKGFEF